MFRIKNGYEECLSNLEEVRRENKSLSEEIRDIMEQISEGGRCGDLLHSYLHCHGQFQQWLQVHS